MIFLFRGVIFRFQPLVFGGVNLQISKVWMIIINHINLPQKQPEVSPLLKSLICLTKNLHICQGTVLMHMLSAKTVETWTLLKKTQGTKNGRVRFKQKKKQHQHHNMKEKKGVGQVLGLWNLERQNGSSPQIWVTMKMIETATSLFPLKLCVGIGATCWKPNFWFFQKQRATNSHHAHDVAQSNTDHP